MIRKPLAEGKNWVSSVGVGTSFVEVLKGSHPGKHPFAGPKGSRASDVTLKGNQKGTPKRQC